PVVFAAAGDPVANGLVESLARPGGNLTGLSVQQTDLGAKRLEVFRELIPRFDRLTILANVENPITVLEMREVQAAARSLGLHVNTVEVRGAKDIAPAIAALKGRTDGIYIQADPLLNTHRIQINTLALSAQLPTMYGIREFVDAGGLMSYGPNFSDLYRRAVAIKQPVQIADVQTEPGYFDAPPFLSAPQMARFAGARTIIAVPMLKDNELIGAIVIYRQEVRPFTDKQVALVKNFADQAVIAIENVRLFDVVQARTKEIQESL